MPDALQIVIDPYLVCLPNPCDTLEQIDAFVNALLGWRGIMRRQDVNVLLADAVRIALLEDGEYPHQHKLREILREHRYEFADHETICRITQNLLEHTPSLEDFYGVEAVLIDETKTRVVPSEMLNRLKSKTRSALIEMFVIIAVEDQSSCRDFQQRTFVATTNEMSEENADPVDVSCDFELCDWSWLSEERHSLPSLPAAMSGVMPLATSHMALLRQLGTWRVWKQATDGRAAVEAIELCISELVASGVSDEGRTRYRLGPSFLESARAWGFGNRSDYSRLLVESCARIVLNIPKNDVVVFRESKDSTQQRGRNDGALAYRTHLTKKGSGFRLMLWKLADGAIEFANVGDKDELTIL